MSSPRTVLVAILLALAPGCIPPGAPQVVEQEASPDEVTPTVAGDSISSDAETEMTTALETVPEGFVQIPGAPNPLYVTSEVNRLMDLDIALGIPLAGTVSNEDIHSINLLGNVQFTDDDASMAAASFPNLKMFILQPPHAITEAGIDEIVTIGTLEDLRLQGVQLTDRQMEAIGILQHLRALDLAAAGVTDDQLQYLGGLSGLETLSLRGNPLTRAAVPHLAELKSLNRLTVTQCPLANDGIEDLKAALPQTTVLH